MKTMFPQSAAPWSLEPPKVAGEFLVEYIGDYFPPGNINNVTHNLVHVVIDDGGNLKLLRDGRLYPVDHFWGWKWARIIPYST